MQANQSSTTPADAVRSLDVQREEFRRNRFLAMPLAGTVAWAATAVAGALLPTLQAMWALFIATGSIAYLGMFLSKFTGEHMLDKSKPKNAFDSLFMHTVAMASLAYAIVVPFAMQDPSAAVLGMAVAAGMMWLPVSWMIGHPIGLFHAIARTVLATAAWFAFPQQRFVVVPLVVVALYVVTIVVLERRWRRLRREDGTATAATLPAGLRSAT